MAGTEDREKGNQVTTATTKPLRLDMVDYIQHFRIVRGYSPTYREIQEALGLPAVSMVAYNVRKLIAAGYLRHDRETARSLVPTFELLPMSPCPHCGCPSPGGEHPV